MRAPMLMLSVRFYYVPHGRRLRCPDKSGAGHDDRRKADIAQGAAGEGAVRHALNVPGERKGGGNTIVVVGGGVVCCDRRCSGCCLHGYHSSGLFVIVVVTLVVGVVVACHHNLW